MNKVSCSNCGFQNEAGLRFCVNCGTALVNQPAPNSNPNQFGANQPPFNAGNSQQFNTQSVKPSNTGRNLAIFGGLGCLGLIVGIAAIFGLLIYAGSNDDKAKSNGNLIVNRNTGVSNSKAGIVSNSNSYSNYNGANTNSNSTDIDADVKNSLPTQIGGFEQKGTVIQGDAAKDFPGADAIYKTEYANSKGKKVQMVIAKFSSADEAKRRFGFFLDGFKTIGAKILGRQKGKDKKGGETEFALYTYKSGSTTVYETMLHSEIYG
ncbi:MAG: zinc ribbon domain-containing protein, partial [Pyrinomonadaceae bacterium]|nr:zinc ribbon domain-containing protein [Pyrinomonadaceae bacterium]